MLAEPLNAAQLYDMIWARGFWYHKAKAAAPVTPHVMAPV